MVILYISNEYPPETGFGGIATYTHTIAHAMAQKGHRVHVICRSSFDVASNHKENDVSIHRISPGTYPLPSGSLFYYFRKLCYKLIPQSLIRLAWAKEVYKTFVNLANSGIKFDIIEFPECGGEGYYISRLSTIATIARLHTAWSIVAKLNKTQEPFFDKLLLNHLETVSISRARGVSSPSKALADISFKTLSKRIITVYPNPIPADLYQQSTGTDWIYTGRVEPRKGVHVLIEAMHEVCKTKTPPLLRLIGRPYGQFNGIDYEEYIDSLLSKYNLQHAIEWTKGTDHDTVRKKLSLSSIAIFPSLWENLSYSCLEAMASGCVVVASNCGGFPEIITHEKNGFLFTVSNATALASILIAILDNKYDTAAIAASARMSINQVYDNAVVVNKTCDWYQSVLSGATHE